MTAELLKIIGAEYIHSYKQKTIIFEGQSLRKEVYLGKHVTHIEPARKCGYLG